MRFKLNEKIFILKELANALILGEDLNMLDIVSTFHQTIYSLLEFVEDNISRFSDNEKIVLLSFLKTNLNIEKQNKKSPKLSRDHLTLVYKEIDLNTGRIKLETTKADVEYVYDVLIDNNVKTTTELMYLALKRYATSECDSLFPFKEYIESKVQDTRIKKQ